MSEAVWINASVHSSPERTKIVPFSPTHYPAYTDLWNQAYPDLRRTELEMRLADMSQAPALSPSRWVVEHQGSAVAVGGFEQSEGELFHPRKYQFHLIVASAYRRRGIGANLYKHVLEALRSTDALLVRAWARQDRTESLSFLAERGFCEEMRTVHSALDSAAFDLSRLASYRQRLEKYGYEFKEFVDLVGDPERNQKTHALYCELLEEIPSPEPRRMASFEDYELKISANPEFFRAHFISIHKGEYVGLCILLPKDRAKRELYADTLGIKRAYRGRGLAQALSHCGIHYAKSRGYSLISADSFVENRGIIPLLDKLGFGNKSVWTLFSKVLASD